MAQDEGSGRRQDRWAHLRFAVVGTLLAAPPKKGELQAALTALAERPWQHPIRGVPVRFARSTLERWYYHARNATVDPVGRLRRRLRCDAGQQPSIGEPLRQALRTQYDAHRSWSYQLQLLEFLHFAHAAAPLVRARSVILTSNSFSSSGCSTISLRKSVIKSRHDGRWACRRHFGRAA